MNPPRPCRQTGLTLIELLIVVAVVGILAITAYPSYVNHLASARRADAQAVLMENAQFLERYFTENNTYAGASLPLAEAPKDGASKYYDLSFGTDEPSATTYLIQAAPKNAMAGDTCGVLTLDQTGQKGADGALADCWRQ